MPFTKEQKQKWYQENKEEINRQKRAKRQVNKGISEVNHPKPSTKGQPN